MYKLKIMYIGGIAIISQRLCHNLIGTNDFPGNRIKSGFKKNVYNRMFSIFRFLFKFHVHRNNNFDINSNYMSL